MKPSEAEDTSFARRSRNFIARPPPAGTAELLAQALLARTSSGLLGGLAGGEHLPVGARVMAKFYGEWHKATVHSFRDKEVVVLWHSEASISALPPCDVKLSEWPSSDISSDLEELRQQQQQQRQPQQKQQLQQQLQQQQQVHLHLQLQLPLQQQEVNPVAQSKSWTPLNSTGVVTPGLVGQAAEADKLLMSGTRRHMGTFEPSGDVHASDDTDTTDSNVLVEAVKVAVDRAGIVDATVTSGGNTPSDPGRKDAADNVLVPGVGKMRRRDLDLLRAVHKGEMDAEDNKIPDLSVLSPEQMQNLEIYLDSAASTGKAASAALEQPQQKAPEFCKGSNNDKPPWEERLSPYRSALQCEQGRASDTTGTTADAGVAPRSVGAGIGNGMRAPPGLENVTRVVPRTAKLFGSIER